MNYVICRLLILRKIQPQEILSSVKVVKIETFTFKRIFILNYKSSLTNGLKIKMMLMSSAAIRIKTKESVKELSNKS